MKSDKNLKREAYFQVFDQRSGAVLGGVLAQLNSSPYEFDSAFSEGDWVVLAKDGQRVFTFSLSTGKQLSTLFGWQPSLDAPKGILSVLSVSNRISLYNLKTGTKIREFDATSPIVYSHFSADGRRLLLLTSSQIIYVIDVSSLEPLPKPD